MKTIQFDLYESFDPKEFLFGWSFTDDSTTVSNWTDNQTITVTQDGNYFCFAKKKNSGRIYRTLQVVNCSGNPLPCVLNISSVTKKDTILNCVLNITSVTKKQAICVLNITSVTKKVISNPPIPLTGIIGLNV